MPEKYRVGIIGRTDRGHYGHRLDIAWFKVAQTEIIAVADEVESGRIAAAGRLKVERAYADYREMMDKEKPDIIAVCPRWVDQHAEMTIEAANRGIHVYMEKPFCRSPKEADDIIEACEAKNVKVAIAHPTRYSPLIDTVKKLIADGAIGRVIELRGRGKEDRRGGAEDLWVLGAHIMDMVLAFGHEPRWCQAQMTQAGEPVQKKHVREGNEGLGPLAGDSLHAVYGLNDGVPFTFDTIRDMQGKPSRYGLQILGSKGIIEILEGTLAPVHILQDASWSPGRSGKRWQAVSSAGIGKPEPLTDPKYKERHQLAIEDFLDCIGNNREPKCGMYAGRKIIEMIMAPFESQRLGKPVSFPLATRVNPLSLL